MLLCEVTLRDPMRYLSNAVRAFETVISQNATRFEPLISPLPIYRDLTLPEEPAIPGST